MVQGLVYDRVAMTWVTPEQKAVWDADREERLFQKRNNQGELCAPMIICDSMPATMSMTDGKMYDSKSAIRREYKRAGVVEVGNDSSLTADGIHNHRQPKARLKTRAEKDAKYREVRADVERAMSKTNLTSYRRDEI